MQKEKELFKVKDSEASLKRKSLDSVLTNKKLSQNTEMETEP